MNTMQQALKDAGIITEQTERAAAKAEQKEQKETRDARAASVARNIKARNVKPDTKAAKEQAAKAKEQAAARMEQVSPVAHDIGMACLKAEDASAGMSALIISAHCSGFTFAELETVELKGKGFPQVPGRNGPRAMTLKDLTAYRQIKSRITRAVENGFSIEPDTTVAELKTASKKGGKGGKVADDGEIVSTSQPGADKPLHFTDKLSVIKAALGTLRDDAEMRRAFAGEVREVARALANDEARDKVAAERAKQKKVA